MRSRPLFLQVVQTTWTDSPGTTTPGLLVAPRDRLLVETDAPYLAPVPWRGRPNASYLVPHTVRAMAEVRGEDLEELCRAIDSNTETAFGGAW